MNGINLVFHSIRAGGGMERYVMDVITELCRRGVPVRAIARKLDWPDAPSGAEWVRVPDRTPFSRLNNLLFERRAWRHCRPDWKTIGISRVQGPVDLAIVGGTHIGHLIDKGKTRPGLNDRLTIAHESRFYAQARRIVAHSARVGEQIVQHYGAGHDKLAVLYPPVDTRTFSLAARSRRDAVRQSLGIAPEQFMLLFPSNNHALKGGDLILAALQGMGDDIVLVVAGKAPLAGPRVVNAGFCRDMAGLYAAADATILASKYEAFGLVGPESILCGTPVLFADTVGAVEVLSEPGCYRFSRDTAALREALLRLRHAAPATEPLRDCIAYPYLLDQHVSRLLEMLSAE
ncbi:glycosyltransferase family 4 protein [Chromobacterium paludis]|uniref:Glycosyltransferase family 4 protein n=1 Tax=Chromobacterium paludis TaxID=2605945 RepID=A0A5C1DKZ7_9NEIS|nr:glycosyltransferase family 4 protein [Chromobacterium paludis]QEL56757.1 glycosyltransferase family 4 protein [Chromobacterium paludis]